MDHIPEKFGIIVRPSVLPDNGLIDEDELNRFENNLKVMQSSYQALADFYGQGSDTRNFENETQLADANKIIADANVSLSLIDCLGTECVVFGQAFEKWHYEKFISEMTNNLSDMKAIKPGPILKLENEMLFILYVEYE